MTLERYLDAMEVRGLDNAPLLAWEYQGHVDETAMARAFELLGVHHPVLRGRIRQDAQGYLLYVPRDHHPEFVVRDGDDGTLQREARGPWDPASAVSRLVLIRSATGGFVALRIDHTIADGGSVLAMFGELWHLYTDIVNGSDVSVEAGVSLPRPPSALFKQRFGIDPSTHTSAATVTPKRAHLYEVVHGHIRLDEENTSRLVAAARVHKTSVHALLCGAIMVAQRAQGTPTEPTPMACWSAVNLRNWVTPPVGATETTLFNFTSKADVTVPANGNPITVGYELKTQLDTSIAAGKLSFDRLQMPPSRVPNPLEQRLATIVVSNVGVLPRLAQPDGLKITNFHPLIVTIKGTSPGFAIYTYDGQMNIRCMYPSDFFTNEEVEQLVERTRAQLFHIGACVPSRPLNTP